MIAAGVVENKSCSCGVCVRQRIAADNVDRGVHGMSNHARFCTSVKRKAAVRCPKTRRLVLESDPEFENIVRMIEDGEQIETQGAVQ